MTTSLLELLIAAKNIFYNVFLIFTNEFKIGFQNRKWDLPNRKGNKFSHFQASVKKTYFTNCAQAHLQKVIEVSIVLRKHYNHLTRLDPELFKDAAWLWLLLKILKAF